jgi:hypothetical protein
MYLFFVSLEPTMTSDDISKVVATLGEDKLGGVLDVPETKREEFRRQSSTTADYRQRLVDYFIKYSPWADWSDLASWLYDYEQPAAVEAARAFITPGKTFKLELWRAHICHPRGSCPSI